MKRPSSHYNGAWTEVKGFIVGLTLGVMVFMLYFWALCKMQ